MTDRHPSPNDPLAPYYPAEVPAVAAEGRTWFPALLALLLLLESVIAGTTGLLAIR